MCAQAVKDRDGRVLLEPGCPLGAVHIKTLKAWGVAHVLVETEQNAEGPSKPDIDRSAAGRFALNDVSQVPFPTLIEWCQNQNEEEGSSS